MCNGRIKKILFTLAAAVMTAASVLSASAETYTYSSSGKYQMSPEAYTPVESYDTFGSAGMLDHPGDIITAPDGRLFIADKGNNRIVILNSQMDCIGILDGFVNKNGEKESFSSPNGIFLADDGSLYVADTMNGRVVVFDSNLQFSRVTAQFDTDVLPDDFIYQPAAVSVNKSGRMYIVSMNTNMGVMVVSAEGAFEGFIGAQRVSANALELFWRMFMSEEQLERSASFVPVEYSDLTIDEEGFVFVTSSSIDSYDLYSAITSTSSSYAPIKKLNPSGTDVLYRYGFFSPVGEIIFDPYGTEEDEQPSSICEVCLLDNGQYMLVDSTHNRMFTYDESGNLLYAFGETGEALGQYNGLASTAVYGEKLYALDESRATVTVLERTDYGRLLSKVCALRRARDYEGSTETWNEIIRQNNNFDLAYLGIGKDYLDSGNYKEAMKYFKLIDARDYYMKAFEKNRQQFLNRYGMWIFAGVILLITAAVKLFGLAGKYNEKKRMAPADGHLSTELSYSLFTVFHPFKAFYELKHEKRGSLRSATVLLALCVLSVVINGMSQAYGMSSGSGGSVAVLAASVLLPVLLWCIANWCFTSLMDGKGRMIDIYISVCYSLTPIILIFIPVTIVSHFLTADEYAILSMVIGVSFLWLAILLFAANMTVHDYTLGKGIAVCLLTVLGIAIILFLCMVFFNLLGDIVSLIQNVSKELRFRA